jgi:alpha-tubulin suppressor-like RCC1 family protein
MPRCDEPTLIPAKLPAKAKRAACGAAHSVVVLEDGSCMSFGDDRNLQLGLRPMTIKEMKSKITRRSTPQPVELLRKRRVVDVACGGGGVEGGHTIFLTRDDEGDELYGCGYGRWGALGGKAYTHIDEPKAISTLSKLRQWDETQKRVVNIRVQALACGERHTAVLLASGNAFVWGWNDHGQLGTGSLAGTHTPQLVKSPPELRFAILKGLACGPNSTAVWS